MTFLLIVNDAWIRLTPRLLFNIYSSLIGILFILNSRFSIFLSYGFFILSDILSPFFENCDFLEIIIE